MQLREILAEARADAKQETETKLSTHLETFAEQDTDMLELDAQLKGFSSDLDSIFSKFDVLNDGGVSDSDDNSGGGGGSSARPLSARLAER